MTQIVNTSNVLGFDRLIMAFLKQQPINLKHPNYKRTFKTLTRVSLKTIVVNTKPRFDIKGSIATMRHLVTRTTSLEIPA